MINEFLHILSRFGDSRHSQVAIYTVFDEESEFQVKNKQILDPEARIKALIGRHVSICSGKIDPTFSLLGPKFAYF